MQNKSLSSGQASPIAVSNENKKTKSNINIYSEEYKKIASLSKAPKKIKDDVISLIPKEVSEKYKLAAFERVGDLVKIAMVNPKDMGALNALRFIAEKENIELMFILPMKKFFAILLINMEVRRKRSKKR